MEAIEQLRRFRNFLGLTQRDCELATGIPAYRIGQAETGRRPLCEIEQQALAEFLKRRFLSVVQGQESSALVMQGSATAR